MEPLLWLQQHWFDFVQTAGIVGGLLYTGFTVREDVESRKISNLIAFKQEHREIWSELYIRPELSRIENENADLIKEPVSHAESLFVKLLVVHLDAVYRATKAGQFIRLEGLRNDIKGFFSLPIPRSVWASLKSFQDDDFAAFVEDCLNPHQQL